MHVIGQKNWAPVRMYVKRRDDFSWSSEFNCIDNSRPYLHSLLLSEIVPANIRVVALPPILTQSPHLVMCSSSELAQA